MTAPGPKRKLQHRYGAKTARRGDARTPAQKRAQEARSRPKPPSRTLARRAAERRAQDAISDPERVQITWMLVEQFGGSLVCGDLRLGFLVSDPLSSGYWTAAALEMPAEATTQGLLDNHAHKIIGENFLSDRDARDACTAYAKKWLARRQAEDFGHVEPCDHSVADPCGCGEIDAEFESPTPA